MVASRECLSFSLCLFQRYTTNTNPKPALLGEKDYLHETCNIGRLANHDVISRSVPLSLLSDHTHIHTHTHPLSFLSCFRNMKPATFFVWSFCQATPLLPITPGPMWKPGGRGVGNKQTSREPRVGGRKDKVGVIIEGKGNENE